MIGLLLLLAAPDPIHLPPALEYPQKRASAPRRGLRPFSGKRTPSATGQSVTVDLVLPDGSEYKGSVPLVVPAPAPVPGAIYDAYQGGVATYHLTGGAAVTVTGYGFGTLTGTVTIAGLAFFVTSWAGDSITGTLASPPAAVLGPVIVTPGSGVPIQSASPYAVAPNPQPPPGPLGPKVSSVTGPDLQARTQASPGALLYVNGSGFGTALGTVDFDPTGRALIQAWSDTQVVLQVPDPHGGIEECEAVLLYRPGDLQATMCSPCFDITAPQVPPPPPAVGAITGYTDLTGQPLNTVKQGTPFQIHGLGFGAIPERVYWDQYVCAVTFWTDTLIQASVGPAYNPQGAANCFVQLPSGAEIPGLLLTVTP